MGRAKDPDEGRLELEAEFESEWFSWRGLILFAVRLSPEGAACLEFGEPRTVLREGLPPHSDRSPHLAEVFKKPEVYIKGTVSLHLESTLWRAYQAGTLLVDRASRGRRRVGCPSVGGAVRSLPAAGSWSDPARVR